jgi:hypothetical protein
MLRVDAGFAGLGGQLSGLLSKKKTKRWRWSFISVPFQLGC